MSNQMKNDRLEVGIDKEEAIEIIRFMAEEGATWKEIAEVTGRSTAWCGKQAKRHGIVKRWKRPQIRWKDGMNPWE